MHLTVVVIRTLLLVGVCSTIVDAANTTCGVGVTVAGLGEPFDGDYMTGGLLYLYKRDGLKETLLTKFDHVEDNAYLSPADAQATLGKWILMSSSNSVPACGSGWGLTPCELYAVCESGCPNMTGHMESGLWRTALWPQAGAYQMNWRLTNGTQISAVSAGCCKRMQHECDACGASTCTGLLNLFDCPAKGIHGRLNPIQRDCCNIQHPPPLELPVCTCKALPTQCDHGLAVSHELGLVI